MKDFCIKKWRLKHGITQKELSNIIGYSIRSISSLENGKKLKNIDLIRAKCLEYERKIK